MSEFENEYLVDGEVTDNATGEVQNDGMSWAQFLEEEEGNSSQGDDESFDTNALLGGDEDSQIVTITFLRASVQVPKSSDYPNGFQPAMFVSDSPFAGSTQKNVKFRTGTKLMHASDSLEGYLISKTTKHYVICGAASEILCALSLFITEAGRERLDKLSEGDPSKKIEFPITSLWASMQYHNTWGKAYKELAEKYGLVVKSKIYIYWMDERGGTFRIPLKTYNVDFAKLVTQFNYVKDGVLHNSALENLSIITTGDPITVGQGTEKTTIATLELQVTEQPCTLPTYQARKSAMESGEKTLHYPFWLMLQPGYSNPKLSKAEQKFLKEEYTLPPFGIQLLEGNLLLSA
jgi:hypothetical protein